MPLRTVYTSILKVVLAGGYAGSLFSPKIKAFFKERKQPSNHWKQASRAASDNVFWFHAASLGEFEQCRPLIEKCKNEFPKHKILVTFFSPSGYRIMKDYPLADWVYYLPFDFPKQAVEFLNHFQPHLAVFIKYEFWPNFLQALSERKIPTLFVSARFHSRQWFFKPYGRWMLKQLRQNCSFFVQNEFSKVLLKKHGIENVSVIGDTRMDRVLNIREECVQLSEITAFVDSQKCFVAGSTWPEDHAVMLSALMEQKEMKIIIAPHDVHPNVIHALESQISVPYAKWSTWNTQYDKNKNILIVDTIGILSQLYQYATLSYVGGGMGTKGLHNILEAAVFGIPIFIGKNYTSFDEAVVLVAQESVISIKDEKSFQQALKKLLLDDALRSGMGAKNYQYVVKSKGATNKVMSYIKKIT